MSSYGNSLKADAHVIVSADDERSAAAIAEEIKARVPVHCGEDRVDVTFSDAMTGSRTMALDVRGWHEVRDR